MHLWTVVRALLVRGCGHSQFLIYCKVANERYAPRPALSTFVTTGASFFLSHYNVSLCSQTGATFMSICILKTFWRSIPMTPSCALVCYKTWFYDWCVLPRVALEKLSLRRIDRPRLVPWFFFFFFFVFFSGAMTTFHASFNASSTNVYHH